LLGTFKIMEIYKIDFESNYNDGGDKECFFIVKDFKELMDDLIENTDLDNVTIKSIIFLGRKYN